ncbi:hypothetical protein K3495_g11058 [Podosphaera aphanis]|nr:hypothetical protein K3495_g11058 [Podosphaera aphanis]
MPPERTKNQPVPTPSNPISSASKPVSTAICKGKTSKTSKIKGLAHKITSANASEAFTQGNDIHLPDTEMTDTEISSSTNQVPENKEPSQQVPGASNSSRGKMIASTDTTHLANASAKEIDTTTATPRRIATPRTVRIVTGSTKQSTGKVDTAQSSSNPSKANTVPHELRAYLEAEERRATQTASNIALCTAAIIGVENALSPLSNGQNKQFIDSMKVYLRAAIAQYMSTGPGSTVPTLPPRPVSNVTFWENPPAGSPYRQPIQVSQPSVVEPVAKATWATITGRGQNKPSTSKNLGHARLKQPNPPRAPAKPKAPTQQDERIFLRLGKSV